MPQLRKKYLAIPASQYKVVVVLCCQRSAAFVNHFKSRFESMERNNARKVSMVLLVLWKHSEKVIKKEFTSQLLWIEWKTREKQQNQRILRITALMGFSINEYLLCKPSAYRRADHFWDAILETECNWLWFGSKTCEFNSIWGMASTLISRLDSQQRIHTIHLLSCESGSGLGVVCHRPNTMEQISIRSKSCLLS